MALDEVIKQRYYISVDYVRDYKWKFAYYLYLDETVRSSLKHQSKDDVLIHLKRKDDMLFDLNLDSKLIEYKKLAADWAKLLKERRIDKKIAEIEQDFVNDDVRWRSCSSRKRFF